jgi:hypothetical protein
MLAVKLHRTPQPRLVKDASLVPIVDWRSGRVQIRRWLRWHKRDHYLTLVKIPEDHPVRLCFSYGPSNFIKQVVWPSEFLPLREWPAEYVRAVTHWWDAWRRPGFEEAETGGLMADEPELILGAKLPDACIRWTKDVRLLYRRPSPRHRARHSRDDA